ncbi:proclotting enzyme-like [Schistocerca gregaria]|uniref:proclotting enzyme-like n=1 Tax=Schistocerca gregaria TaxID=7010 RepID=UPI00211E277A|nr:proclotting enzyme-like [Schistocerca gregaria]
MALASAPSCPAAARLIVSLLVVTAAAVHFVRADDHWREIDEDDAFSIEVPVGPEQGSRRERRQFGWPGILPVGPCFTSKGVLGRCTSFRQCYPYFKLPELTNWETWVLGMYDTCSYFTENGRQMFGVCCTNPVTPRPTQPPRPTPPTEPVVAPEEPSPAPGPVPPNWPPPLPTHSPNNTIPPLPTHPPSPGWPGLEPGPGTTQPVTPPTQPTRPPWQPPTQPTRPTRPPWQPPTQPPATRPPTAAPTPATTPAPQPPGGGADGTCGIKNGYQDQERIVGGHNADLGEWPWIAALFNSGRQFCGGSLIDTTHILTAAHCVAHMSSWDVARVTVRLGDYNIRINTETRHIEKKVKRVVRHRGFDARTLYNDVAILTMDSPVTYSKMIRPVCLPTGSAKYESQEATVIGWGSLRESGPQPAVLQEVTIPIWTNRECKAKYGNAAPGGIVEHFLCAGQAGRDSCSGDSGGPLMINNGRWTQVGIVSWGIGCGKGQYPGVYTRVTHFMPWITKNLK